MGGLSNPTSAFLYMRPGALKREGPASGSSAWLLLQLDSTLPSLPQADSRVQLVFSAPFSTRDTLLRAAWTELADWICAIQPALMVSFARSCSACRRSWCRPPSLGPATRVLPLSSAPFLRRKSHDSCPRRGTELCRHEWSLRCPSSPGLDHTPALGAVIWRFGGHPAPRLCPSWTACTCAEDV